MNSPLLSRAFGFALFLVMVLALPACAQKGGSGGGGTGGGGGSKGGTGSPIGGTSSPVYGSPNYGPAGATGYPMPVGICDGTVSCPTTTPRPMPATPNQDDTTCFLPPVQGIHSPTVSVTRLEVPEKARHEYEKACSEVRHQKYPEAEGHLQKAIDVYSGYTAAWVLMGQVQEQQHETYEANESCSRAIRIDDTYAPSYLCVAFLAAAEQKWNDLEEVTRHLLQLHPINASVAYYYNALAWLRLNRLSSAETSALRGVQDNEKVHQPELHLLLAQIYEKKGDRTSEISQLHEYLKRDPHGDQAAEVTSLLQKLQ
jgi:Tfp pilus assembly protein PilF